MSIEFSDLTKMYEECMKGSGSAPKAMILPIADLRRVAVAQGWKLRDDIDAALNTLSDNAVVMITEDAVKVIEC